MEEIDYDAIIEQLKNELNARAAIANKYGIILSSEIDIFSKGKIIPQKILELINARQEIARELEISELNSFALEAQQNHYLFTFSEELILISKLDLNVNLAKFMPSIRAFLKNLDQQTKILEIQDFSQFDFNKEISKIEKTVKKENLDKDKYKIIKDLIKFIS
ncbi:MAG: hypothetical protein EU550_00350 [Promethearchaeota archaeon]|nr:MAG: hypothetical protein EU550_00350 [Candidatus Lokiarchaeota archaeon]